MVRLFGVHHGGSCVTLEAGLTEVEVRPSYEFLMELGRLPAGTRIGLECLPREVAAAIDKDLARRSFDAGLLAPPFYLEGTAKYWTHMERVCRNLGHEVVYLEDEAVWRRQNEAVIGLAQSRAPLRSHRASRRAQFRGALAANELTYARATALRKVSEIDRERALLAAMRRECVDAAIVGAGHGDIWYAGREGILSKSGLEFEGYSTDLADAPGERIPQYPVVATFRAQAAPSEEVMADRESLERALRLLETGRLCDGRPDYVGTWDILCPTQGYFEVFLSDGEAMRLEGVLGQLESHTAAKIEDILGSAKAVVTQQGSQIAFEKAYVASAPEACKDAIHYLGEMRGHECFGQCRTGPFLRPFYMTRPTHITRHVPNAREEMGLRWFKLAGAGTDSA